MLRIIDRNTIITAIVDEYFIFKLLLDFLSDRRDYERTYGFPYIISSTESLKIHV